MAVRSKRVINPDRFGPATTVVYTVPAGETFRGWIWFANTQAANQDVSVFINGNDDANLFWRGLVLVNDSRRVDNIVLNPGDTLRVGTQAASVHVVLMGSELEGAAD